MKVLELDLRKQQLKRIECYAGGREALCKAVGISLRTYDRHKAEPWRFLLGELRRLGDFARAAGLPWTPEEWKLLEECAS